MTTAAKFPRLVLIVGALAMMIPITGAYFWSFLLLCWLVSAKGWREAPRDQALEPIHWGAVALIATQVLASLVAYLTTDYAPSLARVLKTSAHMTTKYLVLWLVLSAGHKALARRGFKVVRDGAPWLLGFLTLHLIYCFAQRQTGIDWTHGFHATLGPHRFAYGVYRVSGFTGHPLTLSYNLMLLSVAAIWVVSHRRASLARATYRCWVGILGLSFVTLVITGSRFPLVALAATVLVCEWRRLWRYKWWVAGGAAVMVLALALEGSTVGRVGELFDQNRPLAERFPRLVTWQVNWRMFTEHPLAGVGMAGLDRAYEGYYAGIPLSDKIYTAHNVFLQFLADTGVIGFLGLLASLASFVLAARRLDAEGDDGSALRYLVTAAVFSGLLQNNFRDSEFLYAFWLLTAALSVELREHRKSPQNLQSAARSSHSAAHLPG